MTPSTCQTRSPTQRDQLEYVLVSGAAIILAQDPCRAIGIAEGIKNVLNALHPQHQHSSMLNQQVPSTLEATVKASGLYVAQPAGKWPKGVPYQSSGQYAEQLAAGAMSAINLSANTTPSAQADQHIESGMTFGAAIEALKVGQSVARAGWNGKGMFMYLVPAASYPAQTGAAKAYFGKDALVPYAAYLALKNVDGTVNTWAPSVSDALAEDWALAP